jgi:capsule polysaccharide export protein KpsC/LpsZ
VDELEDEDVLEFNDAKQSEILLLLKTVIVENIKNELEIKNEDMAM